MYTADVLRDLLWPWGDGVKHGHWPGHPPADPDVPRLAVAFGPRLPCRADFLDISRAFAALNPALPARIDDLGFYRATGQLTRQQLGLWLFYVEGWGAKKFRDDWQAMSREARTLLLDLEQQRPGRHASLDADLRGDQLVAERLGISRATVYRDRNEAIERMVGFLNPTQARESAA
jgi:hypothetical protein